MRFSAPRSFATGFPRSFGIDQNCSSQCAALRPIRGAGGTRGSNSAFSVLGRGGEAELRWEDVRGITALHSTGIRDRHAAGRPRVDQPAFLTRAISSPLASSIREKARSSSPAMPRLRLDAILATDPFVLHRLARYEVIEFERCARFGVGQIRRSVDRSQLIGNVMDHPLAGGGGLLRLLASSSLFSAPF